MSVSISMVKAGAAAGLSEYYAEKLDSEIEKLAALPENAGRSPAELSVEARVRVRRDEALRHGEDPDRAEAVTRLEIAHERIGGAVGYYAPDAAPGTEEGPARQAWIRGDRVGQAVDAEALQEMFLGSDADGRRLDDPRVQSIKRLAKLAAYDGELTPEAVSALKSGHHPETSEALTGDAKQFRDETWAAPDRAAGSVTASDVTFSAPKAVSILAAFGDRETSEAIIAAQEAAVEDALGWAETHDVITVRRGAQGAERQAATLGEVARVTELTSREGDPQLHCHTLISAFVTGADGRASALDGQALMGASAVLDGVYRRALSARLAHSLGIQLDADATGRLSEVAGIDDALVKRFSTRRAQIAETLAERSRERDRLERVMGDARSLYVDAHKARGRGEALTETEERRADTYQAWLDSGTTAAAAALSTRQAKAEESEEAARARWAADPESPDGDALLQAAQAAARAETVAWTPESEAEFHAQLGAALTESAGRFSTKEAIALGMHLAPSGVTADEVVASVRGWLQDGAVQLQVAEEVGDPRVGDEWVTTTRGFTTTEVVAEQQHIVEMGRRMSLQTVEAMKSSSMADLAALCESYGLSDDQERLVSAISTGQRLVVAEGPAGSGKSHLLGLVAEHAKAHGMQVTVLSTKADLAAELGAEIGADRAMSLQKATMRVSDAPVFRPGAFESGYWAQGLTPEASQTFYALKRQLREADTPEQREEAEAALQAWADALPTREEREQITTARDRVERYDKASKIMGDGVRRQELYEERAELIAAAAEDPSRSKEADFDAPQIFIVDEAAMTDNVHLSRLLEHTSQHPDSQVVFVGDSAQLAAVGRAGGYRALVDEVGAVEMAETRRAKAEWERDVQLQMRALPFDGSAETREAARALASEYLAHDRVWHVGEEAALQAIAEGRVDARQTRPDLDLASDTAAWWWATQRAEHPEDDAMVLTPTRRLQAQVAASIQRHRYADPDDELTADTKSTTLHLDGELTQTAHVGEPVMIRANSPKQGLRNGMSGTVTRIYRDGAVKVQLQDERGRDFEVKIPRKKIEDECLLGLAYTSTAHKAQGATVDRALYVHDTQSAFADRHMLYPSMTRGKEENRILLVGGEGQEAMESFAGAMCRSEAPAALRVVNAPATPEELAEVARMWPGIPAERREEMVQATRAIELQAARDQQHEQESWKRARSQQLAQARTVVKAQGRGMAA